jgi:hypothetical protein
MSTEYISVSHGTPNQLIIMKSNVYISMHVHYIISYMCVFVFNRACVYM